MTAQPSWTNLDVINYRFLTTETNLKALYICCFFTQPYQLILKPILKMKTFLKKELHFENENSFWNSFWKWKFWKWKLIPKPILEMKSHSETCFENENFLKMKTNFEKKNILKMKAHFETHFENEFCKILMAWVMLVHTSPIIHFFLRLNSVVEYPIALEVKGRKRYLSSLLFG